MTTELQRNPLYVQARSDLEIFVRHLKTAFYDNDSDEVARYLDAIADHSERFSAALKSDQRKC